MRFAAPRRQMRRAHVPVHRGPQLDREDGARGVHVEDRRRPALLLPAARDFGRGCRVDDRERLLPRSVQRIADGVRGGSDEVAGSFIGRISRLMLEIKDLHAGIDGKEIDRKSTRLNSSHPSISYAVFCLKKKKSLSYKLTPHEIAKTL